MKCSNCGTEFFEGVFCPECGTKYEERITSTNEIDRESIAEKSEIELVQEKERSEKERLELEIAKHKEKRERLEQERLERERLERERLELELAQNKEKRELLERERLEKERLERELAQEKEKLECLEQEKIEEETKRKEEQSRTFNGILYNSVDEMEIVRRQYETEERERKRQKNVDTQALLCMIFGLATWPLVFVLLWPLSFIATIVLGILALKGKTRKKGFVITGFASIGIMVLVCVVAIFLS